MTRETLAMLIFFGAVALTVFGILAYLGGPLAALSMSPFLMFGIVGVAIIAKNEGKTWKNFLDN